MSLSWWNGRLVPAGEVRIDPGDAGFLLGDGLFETLRVDDGHAAGVAAHLDRLLDGLERIGIDLPEDELGEAVAAVARSSTSPVARLRITVTRGTAAGPTRIVTVSPYQPPAEDSYRQGVAAILLPEPRVDSRSPLAGLKSLSRQANHLAQRQAEAAGAFDALLLNERERLAGGSRTNVVLRLSDGLFTPPLSDGCLPGIVRHRLIETGRVTERSLTVEDLLAASALFLTNSLVGALPVGRLDGREMPVDLKAAFQNRRTLD